MSMSKENDNQKIFTRRAFVIGGIQGTLLAVMGGRLAWLQVVEGRKYKTLADKNRINIKMLAPSRGEIVDRYGTPLAENSQNFRVIVVPEQSDDVEAVLRDLQDIIELEERDIERTLEDVKKVAKFIPVEVKDDLSWKDVATIEVNLPDLPGLAINVGERRTYPLEDATAHLVGYVGAVGQAEINEDKMMALPGLRVGKTGIERKYDEALRGEAGSARIEVNVIGREVRELSRTEPEDGRRIVLSVDAGLQQIVQERLNKERSAAAVIMDAHTGAVYALASSPAFNPNLFTKSLPVDVWEGLLSNPGHPLTNKAVAGQYPPGSTFKMMTALAGLQAGVIKRDTTHYCAGYYELGNSRFHCWKRGGHGYMDMDNALSESCDVFFYKVSTEIGIEKIAAMARRFGLGHKLDFDLLEERPGLIPDKDWKRGYLGKSWQPGETVVASIGQGYILTTPLQLAVMTSRLVNGGKAVKPWLVGHDAKGNPFDKVKWPDMGLDNDDLEFVKKGMDDVVNSGVGTARGSRIEQPGMEMGGKTGTAQVARITMAQRAAGVDNEDLPWKFRHHALFVGYAPIDNPRYVASVVVEHGVSGSATAAPLARDLLLSTQRRSPARSPMISASESLTDMNELQTVIRPPVKE